MINNHKNEKAGSNMTLPRSVIFNSLKDAIETKEESRIGELADILHGSMEYHLLHSSGISDNTARIDLQNQNIANILETMKEGFRQTDIRFKDLINQMNARFEQVDKRFEQIDKRFEAVDLRFEDLIKNMNGRFTEQMNSIDKRFSESDSKFRMMFWLVGIGFVTINTMIVLFKFFV